MKQKYCEIKVLLFFLSILFSLFLFLGCSNQLPKKQDRESKNFIKDVAIAGKITEKNGPVIYFAGESRNLSYPKTKSITLRFSAGKELSDAASMYINIVWLSNFIKLLNDKQKNFEFAQKVKYRTNLFSSHPIMVLEVNAEQSATAKVLFGKLIHFSADALIQALSTDEIDTREITNVFKNYTGIKPINTCKQNKESINAFKISDYRPYFKNTNLKATVIGIKRSEYQSFFSSLRKEFNRLPGNFIDTKIFRSPSIQHSDLENLYDCFKKVTSQNLSVRMPGLNLTEDYSVAEILMNDLALSIGSKIKMMVQNRTNPESCRDRISEVRNQARSNRLSVFFTIIPDCLGKEKILQVLAETLQEKKLSDEQQLQAIYRLQKTRRTLDYLLGPQDSFANNFVFTDLGRSFGRGISELYAFDLKQQDSGEKLFASKWKLLISRVVVNQ